jgi:hypothetical protein
MNEGALIVFKLNNISGKIRGEKLQHLPGSKLTNLGFLMQFQACHYLHRCFTALFTPFLGRRSTISRELRYFSTTALYSACLRLDAARRLEKGAWFFRAALPLFCAVSAIRA